MNKQKKKVKYCVCILCNNLQFLKAMMYNMPRQNEEIVFVIGNDTRVVDLENDIKEFFKNAKRLNLNNKVIVITDKKVNKFCEDTLDMNESGNEYLYEYTMGMNINLQYYLMFNEKADFEKILFLDDDVLINRNLMDIFKKDDFLFARENLVGGASCKGSKWNDIWVELSGAQDADEFYDGYINSGVRMYINEEKYREVYKGLLKQFFENKRLRKWFNAWKKTGKNKGLAFFQDQEFENSFALKIGKRNRGMEMFCNTLHSFKEESRNVNLFYYTRKHITHYVCGSWKKEFLRLLDREGVIILDKEELIY